MEQRTLGRTGLSVSVLGLGTVELGMKYGLGVEMPPPKSDAIALLQYVAEKGITYFDTARSYGVAEELIGESGIGNKPGVVIGTKCGAFYEKGEDPRGDELRQRITDDVNASLKALRRETIDLLQAHGPSAEVIERGELLTVLMELKEQGKARHIGIATRGEDASRAAIRTRKIQTIQVGLSILDQRMRDRVIPEASAVDAGIIVRSVFLKGVLTPRRQFLPKDLNILRARANAIEEYALRHGMELEEVAVRFVLSMSEVSTLLIGTAKKEHIDAAYDRIERGILPAPILNELSAFRLDDERLIDPKHWKL